MSYKEEIGNDEHTYFMLGSRLDSEFYVACNTLTWQERDNLALWDTNTWKSLNFGEWETILLDMVAFSCQQRMMPTCGSVWSKMSTSRAPSRRVKRPSN